MKITFFFVNLGKTGGPLIHFNFMNQLVKNGYEVYMVTPTVSFKWEENSNLFFDTLPKNRFTEFTNKVWMKLFRNQIGILLVYINKRLIKKYNDLKIESDVFIASHTYTFPSVYELGREQKIVAYNMHHEELMFKKRTDRNIIAALNFLPFHHLSLSTWLKKMFKYNYNINSTVMNPGIDNSIFEGEPTEEKFKSAEKIKIISYCDPFRNFKGYKHQISILKKVLEKTKDIEIIFYGHDPKTDALPYTFLGWVSQKTLAENYKNSHILFMPSLYESFPLPPIEAMSCGCSVIAGRYGTEDYLFDNQNGIVINPTEEDASAQKIITLIQDRDKMFEFAKEGKETSKRFLWDTQGENFINFINQIQPQKSLSIEEIHNGKLDEINKIENI